jgi:hypothetical protein
MSIDSDAGNNERGTPNVLLPMCESGTQDRPPGAFTLCSIVGSPRRVSESFDEALPQWSIRVSQPQDAQVDAGGLAAQLPVPDAGAAKGWKPVLARERKVSAALKAYAKLVTSADKGAVRNLDLLAE